jgi:DNA-binding SARP family transcriptional activator
MLGALHVVRDGRTVILPTSRKLQALLTYLVLSSRAIQRSRLCALFWDDATDPRGELRWYLSKLRSVVGAKRVVCDEGAVRIDLTASFVDAHDVERAAEQGIGNLTPRRAREVLQLFTGDFLEGLEVDGSPQFTSWLLAQRRQFRARHIALLERLVQGAPADESFGYLSQWLELAPLDVRAHELLLCALARQGRVREGEEHLAASIRLFEAEAIDSAPLANAWRKVSLRRSSVVPYKPVRRSTSEESAQAYDHYQQGRQQLTRMMQRGLKAGGRMFVRALKIDAGYGPAWAGLATVDACLAEWFDPRKSRIVHAEYASQRALELAPHLGETHAARGFARSLSRHYDEAACEFEAAIRLNPYLFDAYYYFGRTAFACGNMTRAAELFRSAMDIRQEDFQSAMLLGMALRATGRDEAASDAVRTGIRRAEQVLLLNPQDGRALSLGAGALIDDGQVERALQWSRQALAGYADDTSALVNVACVYARVGQAGDALDLLERVFARGCGKRDWVENDPDYGSLRTEPRFQQLVSRLS